MEKEFNLSIPFLNVFISHINIDQIKLRTYQKPICTVIYLNFIIFTSSSHKTSLVIYLLDKHFKICNNWNSFHTDFDSFKDIMKNSYPTWQINQGVKKLTRSIFFLILIYFFLIGIHSMQS